MLFENNLDQGMVIHRQETTESNAEFDSFSQDEHPFIEDSMYVCTISP
jgi:hypothetical protein